MADAERIGRWGLTALCVVGVAWGCWARLTGVQRDLLFGDEFHSLKLIAAGYAEAARTFDPGGSGLALPLLQRLVAGLVGLNHWSLRLPALLGSLAAIALCFRLARRADGRAIALGAVLLLATSPFQIFYGHFGRIYALVGCAALLLLSACVRLTAELAPLRRHYVGLAVLSALLPYLHLSAAALVLCLAVTLLAILAARPALRGRVARAAGAVAAGGAVCALLYAPAWSSLMRFVGTKTHERYAGGVEALTVLVVLGAGHLGAYVLAVGGALGLVQAARRRDALSWFLAAGVVGPAIVLAALRPYGDAYAYARYLLPSAVLASWCVGRGLADLVGSRPSVRRVASLLPSLLMTGAVWAGGPPTDGPHGGSYLALVALPAFDVPWPERSSFYRALERERGATIIEAPALMTRTRQLHRNAFLQHRCRTLLGFFPEEEPAWLPRGAYVSLLRGSVADSVADYLIVHRDAGAEVRRYWGFVFKQAPGRDASTRALMERQRVYYGPLPRPSSCLVARLRRQLGVPAYEDADLLVWDLRRLRRVQGPQEVLK